MGNVFEKGRSLLSGILQMEYCAPILTAPGRLDVAAERARDPLHAVADTQNWNVLREHCRIALGRSRVVNGIWAAGEDDAGGFVTADFFDGSRTRKNCAEDFLFADAPCDELGVLTAKIEHHHAAALRLWLSVFFLHCRSSRHCVLHGGRFSLQRD